MATTSCKKTDSVSDSKYICSVIVKSRNRQQILVPIQTIRKTVETNALIDCGADNLFINRKTSKGRELQKLNNPIRVRNIDRTNNKEGDITHHAWVEYKMGGSVGSWYNAPREQGSSANA